MEKDHAHRITEKVLVLEAKYIQALGAIRGIAGVKAAADGELIWLRGIAVSGAPDIVVNSLPIVHSYGLDKDSLLFPPGGKTPVAKLKALNWQPITAFIPVELPVSAMPGAVSAKMSLRLSRSEITREPYALLTSLAEWKVYADTAPAVRLQQLRFAVSGAGQTIIIGSPLPVIKGQTYWLNQNKLLPAGFDFDPPAIGNLILPIVNEEEPSLQLFDEAGNWEVIPLSCFQPAKRSAIRLTQITNG